MKLIQSRIFRICFTKESENKMFLEPLEIILLWHYFEVLFNEMQI